MKKIVVLFLVLFALMGNAFAAEPVTTPIAEPAANAVQVEAEKKPLKILLITLGVKKKGEKRIFTEDGDNVVKYSPESIKQRITVYHQYPEIAKLSPTSIKDPETLRPLISKLNVDRIIVYEIPGFFLQTKGKYKGVFIGNIRAYVMEKNGDVIADYTRECYIIRDVDWEKIETPPDVIRQQLVKDQVQWEQNGVRAINEMISAYY